ncbi:VirB3 family type IV secretion system protein [Salmonella enterica]
MASKPSTWVAEEGDPQWSELEPYPLFKGATRVPTTWGVPMMPLLYMTIFVALIALNVNIFCWALWPVLWWIMAQITKTDDKAFRIWGLFFDTKVRNGLFGGSYSFWDASSYSPNDYRKKRS